MNFTIVSSSPNKWTGIGFSDTPSMSLTDAIIGRGLCDVSMRVANRMSLLVNCLTNGIRGGLALSFNSNSMLEAPRRDKIFLEEFKCNYQSD
jgi:hypothetical protein